MFGWPKKSESISSPEDEIKCKFTDQELDEILKIVSVEVRKDLENEYDEKARADAWKIEDQEKDIAYLETQCGAMSTALDIANGKISMMEKSKTKTKYKSKTADLASEIFGSDEPLIDQETGEIL